MTKEEYKRQDQIRRAKKHLQIARAFGLVPGETALEAWFYYLRLSIFNY
jgi:hypothetical protein